MTQETAKSILPIIKAYSEGKVVQIYSSIRRKWEDVENPEFNCSSIEYRIKPESTYRPYNHNDFDKAAASHHNTVRDTKSGNRFLITAWSDKGWKLPTSQTLQSWSFLLSDFVWNDDESPCGVLTDNNE